MSRSDDIKILQKLPKEKIPEYVFLQLRNLWTMDGLYYLGIEERYGTEVATEIDAKVWAVLGKIEARKLKKFLDIQKDDIPSMMQALQYSSWALDLEEKEIKIQKNHAMIRNTRCRVQNTRKNKGLPEFGCKPVRLGFLQAFAKEFNQRIVVTCKLCPPDPHPEDLWCQWEFTITEE